MDTAPLPFPTRRSKRPGKSWLNHAGKAFLFLLGIVAVAGSGWLGVQSAKLRQRPLESLAPALPETSVMRSSDGDSVYLAESASALRRFFVTFPTAFERANAEVESYQIRKLRGNLEMRTLRAEGDVVQVEISGGSETRDTSGGTIFWIHHSQMPAATSFDPIIPPIPQ